MKTQALPIIGGLILGVILTAAAPASPHSFPERQNPAAGQILTSPPSAIAIKYDAPIEKLFARLQVIGSDGKDKAIDKPQVSSDGYTLSVKVGELKPGEYKVIWGVIGIDTHHTQGSYSFTIGSKGG
jgi:methionine-rich copper-binding protein CopC